jgi:hypothetical protein
MIAYVDGGSVISRNLDSVSVSTVTGLGPVGRKMNASVISGRPNSGKFPAKGRWGAWWQDKGPSGGRNRINPVTRGQNGIA